MLLALGVVFIFFQALEELKELGKAQYTSEVMIKYILLLSPSLLNSLIVIATMMGTVLALGELNSNKELQIFETASISKRKIIFYCLRYPVYLSIFMIFFFELFAPNFYFMAENLKGQALGNYTSNIQDQLWIRNDENFIRLNSKEDGQRDLIVLEIKKNQNLESYISASNVKFSDDSIRAPSADKLVIKKTSNLYLPNRSTPISNYELNLKFLNLDNLKRDVRSLSVFELIEQITTSIKNQINYKASILELLSRIIRPITLIGMILLVIPYVVDYERTISVGKRLFISISLGVFTHLFTKIMNMTMLKFDFLLFIGPLLPSIMLVVIGFVLLKYKYGLR